MDHVKTTTKLGWIGVVAVLALAGCDRDPLVHQDTKHAQKIYEGRAIGWTKWALEQPWSTGPVRDTDGSACALEQHGSVWYLAGTTGGAVERACTVPADAHIFFPLMNRWVAPTPDSIIEDDPENDLAAWLAFVVEYFAERRAQTCALSLRLDDEDLLPDLESMDEELYVDVLDQFTVNMGDDNFATDFGGTAGPRVTWVDGHWALLRPLPPGDHTLEFGGTRCVDGEAVFETNATYQLHVE